MTFIAEQTLSATRAALGFNIAAEPVRLRAVQRAVSSGNLTATDPVNLIQVIKSG